MKNDSPASHPPRKRNRIPGLLLSAASRYFLTGLQAHSDDALPQPEHTLFSILRPHTLHGEHPHVWHMCRPPFKCPSRYAVSTTFHVLVDTPRHGYVPTKRDISARPHKSFREHRPGKRRKPPPPPFAGGRGTLALDLAAQLL